VALLAHGAAVAALWNAHPSGRRVEGVPRGVTTLKPRDARGLFSRKPLG